PSFQTSYELWRNKYVIRPEGNYEGITFMSRCYLEVMPHKVEAIITGGSKRNVNQAMRILVDGSYSRDYSKPKKNKQFNRYRWDCESLDDNRNQYCKKQMAFKGARLQIPANVFRHECQYDFTLTVVADDNPRLGSKAYQTINVVDYEVLHVTIVCITNCAYGQYNPMNNVRLMAQCLDCGTETIKYSWYAGGQYTLNSRNLIMHLGTLGTLAVIKLVVQLSDGREGSAELHLMKTVRPVRGSCDVKPKVGIEATTPFFVCCTGYVSAHKPIEFFYYADRVLLNRCSQCDCPSHLPLNVKQIKVLICDRLWTCRTTFVDVTVTPLENPVVEPPEALWDFITAQPNDVVGMVDRGLDLQFYQTIESLACRIKTVESGYVLMRAFENVHPESLNTLGKLANLTQTFGLQLNPIDTVEHALLTMVLTKLNDNFQRVKDNAIHMEMGEQPYINVTTACVTVFDMMDHLNRLLPRPPQSIYDKYRDAFNNNKLKQDVIDKLTEEINDYDEEEAKKRSLVWLNALWQTERLYRFLKITRQYGLQADPYDVSSQAVALEIQCFELEANHHYTIKTSDGMHIVYFTPELLHETKAKKTNYICLKVISTIRELNWWYPEEKQPSSVLLSVRIYVYEDDFTEEVQLYDSDIRFETIVGKYKPALDRNGVGMFVRNFHIPMGFFLTTPRFFRCLESGTVNYMQQVRLYRVNVEGHAMVTVRFKESSHKLQVLLYIGERPKSWRNLVSKAKCFVPSNSSNKIMLIRNKCRETKRAYMAIQVNGAADYDEDEDTPVPNGPASFAFVFQERSCDYWKYSLPEDFQHWSHDHCLPILEYQKKGHLHCTCTVLGTYTSYVYHIPATAVPLEASSTNTNVVLLVMYIIIFTLIFIWLVVLVIWCNKRPTKTVICDMGAFDSDSNREVHDLLIFLKTGGRINAQTTATVRLIFQTTQRAELQFTIMQDPEHPQLSRNSTYVLLIRTRDIRIPTRIAVAHTNAGRYPSWYLKRIELMDLQKQMTQVFIVNRWVLQKFLILSSSMVLKAGDERVVEKWRERFVSTFEVLWINWGLWHPLTGKWRDSKSVHSLSRAQRVCVFVSKMMVTYCIVVCMFGHSTRHSVYEDRKLTINGKNVLIMFVYCAIATNLVHFIFVSIILRRP
ncbi:hypothetical protein KR044_001105, partial [Drosophila immigrans]